MKRVLAGIAGALALMIGPSGCSHSPEQALIGIYHCEIDSSGILEQNKWMAETNSRYVTGGTIKIEKSHKAMLVGSMWTRTEATWKLEGNSLSLTPKVGPPKRYVVEDGGKSLLMIPSDKEQKLLEGLKIRFVRQ